MSREKISVWTRKSVHPNPDAHVLQTRFQFALPENIPPFNSSSMDSLGVAPYLVEVVSTFPVALRSNKQVPRTVAVLPAESAGIPVQSLLRLGRSGAWSLTIR